MLEACRVAGREGARRATFDRLLQLALDACGAERAFVIRGRRSIEGALEPVVVAQHQRRDDGVTRPSRTVALAALARSRAFSWAELGRETDLAEAGSVRGLELRSVVAAPLPTPGNEPGALVLDSRTTPLKLGARDLIEIVDSFAALIGLVGFDKSAHATAVERTGIVGRSPTMVEMLDWAGRAARSRLPVLVRGETGSGKEGVSRLIHHRSARRDRPFVAFNCTALAETLLEAELFGSARGAFTGSVRDRRGLLQLAHRGTLMLDEVGDMSLALQAKLLRALQENTIRPVGGEVDVPIDVRIVAATHQDLSSLVGEGRFRSDLYYRLAVIEIAIPPLRDRISDLPLLVESLSARLIRETGYGPLDLAPDAWRVLEQYDWPGNVRELHAVLARALLRSTGTQIGACHVKELTGPRAVTPGSDAHRCSLEKQMIETALRNSGGSITGAARQIGWTRQKLSRRIKVLSVR